jgi:hypothetical protein
MNDTLSHFITLDPQFVALAQQVPGEAVIG